MMDIQEYHGERNVSLLHDILYSNAFQEKAAGKYVVNISNEQRETLRHFSQILLCRYAEVDIQMVICMDYNPVNQHGNDGTPGITGRGIKCFGPGQDYFQFVICRAVCLFQVCDSAADALHFVLGSLQMGFFSLIKKKWPRFGT